MHETTLPFLLTVNDGFVDTAGFLALHGLFAAHVTGNFVTLGAALTFGTSGVVSKLLATPVFCIVVALVCILGVGLVPGHVLQLRPMLGGQFLLLFVGGALAIHWGPFRGGDSWPAIATGMVLVCAMAVQNAVQRIALAGAPPTTLMTGTTTQLTIDLINSLRRKIVPAARAEAQKRMSGLALSLFAFAAGCAGAAVLISSIGMWCFVLPPVLLATSALSLRESGP